MEAAAILGEWLDVVPAGASCPAALLGFKLLNALGYVLGLFGILPRLLAVPALPKGSSYSEAV